ncbi:START domain-containing protein [soil metagenome]
MKRLFLFLLTLATFVTAFSQSDCTLKTDKDGIKVYTCEVKNSKFKAVKSSFVLNSTLSEFGAAVMDIDHYCDWQYKTLSAKTLKKVSESEVVYYTEVAAPVLTDNRDFVIQLTMNQNPQSKVLIVDLISLPTYTAAKEGVIRVPFSKARYTVKALSAGLLHVDYYIEIDLGGNVPPWMVNMVAHEAPFKTFKDLQKIIGNYKGQGIAGIQD